MRSVAMVGLAVLVLLLAAGCSSKDGPTASACEGFSGGNIVGKWQYRWLGSPVIYEYRSDGTYREDLGGGRESSVKEGTYEIDGNEIRTVSIVGTGTATGYRCFDVQGSSE